MFSRGAEGPAPSLDHDDASELTDDEEPPTWTEEHPDEGVFETDELHEVHKPPDDIHGRGGIDVYCGNRRV